jgi:AcrR family transcriptional regulator
MIDLDNTLMKRAQKREHLIKVAAQVFNRMGYHAAGVDRVIAETGIAKTTLYRHFESKEDLIVAVLRCCADHGTHRAEICLRST